MLRCRSGPATAALMAAGRTWTATAGSACLTRAWKSLRYAARKGSWRGLTACPPLLCPVASMGLGWWLMCACLSVCVFWCMGLRWWMMCACLSVCAFWCMGLRWSLMCACLSVCVSWLTCDWVQCGQCRRVTRPGRPCPTGCCGCGLRAEQAPVAGQPQHTAPSRRAQVRL
jgi:hypothetical protein